MDTEETRWQQHLRDYHDVPFPEGTQPATDEGFTTDEGFDLYEARRKAIAKATTGMETELPTEIHVKIDPSLLPKPASEWTVETIAVIRGRDGDFGLAAAINAALAAAQPKPTTGDDRPSKRPSIEHGEDYLPDRPATGEWTVYSVMKLRQKHWHEEDKNNAIAIAHNAALADQRESLVKIYGRELAVTAQQLAAEQDKTKELRRLLDAAGCSVIDEE